MLSFFFRGRHASPVPEFDYQRDYYPSAAFPRTECVSLIVEFGVVKPIDSQM